jgi:hypothetical protein
VVTSALKMEPVRFSETLASTSQSTRRPNPEEHHHHHHRHRRENLKSHRLLCCINLFLLPCVCGHTHRHLKENGPKRIPRTFVL